MFVTTRFLPLETKDTITYHVNNLVVDFLFLALLSLYVVLLYIECELFVLKQNQMENDMIGDKLILRGLKFYGYHGAIPEEKTLGQMFMLDIDAWMCLKKAGLSDNLEDSVSYVDIYKLVLLYHNFN